MSKKKMSKMTFEKIAIATRDMCDDLRAEGYDAIEVMTLFQIATETARFQAIASANDRGKLTLKR